MIVKHLKSGKCAKCGQVQDYFVFDEIYNTLDLATYLVFKTVNINICNNCGYINDDLEKENGIMLSLTLQNPQDQEQDILRQVEVLKQYSKCVKNPLKMLRVKANIFKLNKLAFDKFLTENYSKKDELIQNRLADCHNRLLEQAREIISLSKENEDSDFAKCLAVEMFGFVGETKQAEDMLNTLDVKPDLKDYLLESIELGGNN